MERFDVRNCSCISIQVIDCSLQVRQAPQNRTWRGINIEPASVVGGPPDRSCLYQQSHCDIIVVLQQSVYRHGISRLNWTDERLIKITITYDIPQGNRVIIQDHSVRYKWKNKYEVYFDMFYRKQVAHVIIGCKLSRRVVSESRWIYNSDYADRFPTTWSSTRTRGSTELRTYEKNVIAVEETWLNSCVSIFRSMRDLGTVKDFEVKRLPKTQLMD